LKIESLHSHIGSSFTEHSAIPILLGIERGKRHGACTEGENLLLFPEYLANVSSLPNILESYCTAWYKYTECNSKGVKVGSCIEVGTLKLRLYT
jgi:hypothetical protein